MFNVTGSAGSARQTRLLTIISICTIDLKDNLLPFFFFFLDLKPYVPHSIHTDTAAQRDKNWISYISLELKQSLGGLKMIRLTLTHQILPTCGYMEYCKDVRLWPRQLTVQLPLARKLK